MCSFVHTRKVRQADATMRPTWIISRAWACTRIWKTGNVPSTKTSADKFMSKKILCVDDEPNILQAYQRSLRKQFAIDTALGGAQALELIASQGPYAVIVADMQMPGMNGIEFLIQAAQKTPDTVRIMLTGNADQKTAVEAGNKGHVFQFL